MEKDMKEMTDRELLRMYSAKVRERESLHDDELNILSEHPNRDFWDKELEEEYQETVGKILVTDSEIKIIEQYIDLLD